MPLLDARSHHPMAHQYFVSIGLLRGQLTNEAVRRAQRVLPPIMEGSSDVFVVGDKNI